MNKELTPLEALDKIAYTYGYDEYVEIVSESLKALEIIKENVGLKMSVDEDVACLYIPLGKGNLCVVGYIKDKDKIDLLKEVLL